MLRPQNLVFAWRHNLIVGSIQFEYDPDELATKITGNENYYTTGSLKE